MKKRNPFVKELSSPKYKSRVEKSTTEKEEQSNKWSRKAKHKVSSIEEALQHGDAVEFVSGPLKKVLDRAAIISRKEKGEEGEEKVKKHEAIVKEPKGPAGTVGISVDGEYHLVDEDDLNLLCEAFASIHEMRYIDITSGVRVPISGEEQEIFDKAKEKLYKVSLDERDQEVARKMVSRGLINRRKDDSGIFFIQNIKQLTRF